MPPRRALAVKRGPRAIRSSSNRKAGDGEEVDDQEDEEASISIWVTLKLWIAKHDKKWAAVFYAIFLLIFTLVVLRSQVVLSVG
jgi:hypothetical protein